ncbi:Class V chitinase [Cardamine amara subsp. amara]|uniref:Class V chitinase n=1 Tax=Cardamine amara subsp. amara TaxID=228776 RepID=A0ABD1AEM5_CARAN
MSSPKHISLIVSIPFLFSQLLPQSSSAQTVVKASYWSSESDFPITDINSSLFTHIFCAFAEINTLTYQVMVSSSNKPKFSTFTQTVRRRNPTVRTLLSIGPDFTSNFAFASMASNLSSRKKFIGSSIKLARSYGFEGLDLYSKNPSTATEMADFGKLLREWQLAVVAEARSSGKPRLLLTAAVYYSYSYFSVLYPVQAVADSLDWVNLVAYDFCDSGWSRITCSPAPLYAGQSGDAGVRAWIHAGLPAKKSVLGFPYHGYAWRLKNANSHNYYADTTRPAISRGGPTGYDQIRRFIVNNKATIVYNSTLVQNYCYANTTWIGYDDYQSIVTKVRYAKQRGLLGYFSWHVGTDDNSRLSRTASQAWDAKAATTIILRKF